MSENIQENDYLTVSEFAEIVGMNANTIRHYDKKGVSHPIIVPHRLLEVYGVDDLNGLNSVFS